MAMIRIQINKENTMKKEYTGSNNRAAIYLVGFLLSLQFVLLVIPTMELGQILLMGAISAIFFTFWLFAVTTVLEDSQ